MESQKATTAIFIDKYHPKANGVCAVSIRVTNDRKKKYYPTPISLTPAEFEKTLAPRPKGEFKELHLGFTVMNEKLLRSLTKCQCLPGHLLKGSI